MDNTFDWHQLSSEWKEIFAKNYFLQQSHHPDMDIWKGPLGNYKTISGTDAIAITQPVFPNKLDIFGTGIKDLSPLGPYTLLKEFYCGDTGVHSLANLAGNEQLERLCCYNTPLANLDGIEHLLALKRLCLSRTQIHDLSPLRFLTRLEKLAVYRTAIADLSPLAHLTNLVKININHTQVVSLQPLHQLTQLLELHCFNTPLPPAEIALFQSKVPGCTIFFTHEQPENEYDDFN